MNNLTWATETDWTSRPWEVEVQRVLQHPLVDEKWNAC